MSKTKLKKRRVSSSLPIIFLGILLIFISSFWHLTQSDLSFSKTPEAPAEIAIFKGNKPQILKISKIDLELKIEEGGISNGKWIVSEKGVTHFDKSSNPGGRSNVVIYGHNKKNILGSLSDLTPGDQISLITENNAEYKYIVSKVETVSPEKIEVISPTNKERLTIYTCTGLLDSKRLVVTAVPVQIKLFSNK